LFLDLCFNTIASSLYKCYFWKLFSYLPSYQGFFCFKKTINYFIFIFKI
jgi:hypothetical protein